MAKPYKSKPPTGMKDQQALQGATTTAEYLRRLSGASAESQAAKCGLTRERYDQIEYGYGVTLTKDEERKLEAAFNAPASVLLEKPTAEARDAATTRRLV